MAWFSNSRAVFLFLLLVMSVSLFGCSARLPPKIYTVEVDGKFGDFSPSGERIMIGAEKSVTVLATDTGETVGSLAVRPAQYRFHTFVDQERALVLNTYPDNHYSVYRIKTGERLDVAFDKGFSQTGVAVSSSGRYVVGVSAREKDGLALQLYDCQQERAVWNLANGWQIWDATFSPDEGQLAVLLRPFVKEKDGKKIYSTKYDLIVLNRADGRLLHRETGDAKKGHAPTQIEYVPDGSGLAILRHAGKRLRELSFHDTSRFKEIRKYSQLVAERFVFSPDSRWILVGHANQTTLIDNSSHQIHLKLDGCSSRSSEFSRDGEQFSVIENHRLLPSRNKVQLRRCRDGKVIQVARGAWQVSDKILYRKRCINDGYPPVWELDMILNGRKVVFKEDNPKDAFFYPGRKLLGTVNEGYVTLWDLAKKS
jgi:hypothetical protein